MKSSNITVTDTRCLEAIRNATAKSLNVTSDKLTENVTEKLQLMKCRILRVYNTKQEVYVELFASKKRVKAKILNPFMSNNVNISFTIDGVIHNEKSGYYITPNEDYIGVVMEFKDKTTKNADYCFLGFIDNDTVALNSNSKKAEILISVEDNYISINEERINITAKNLFVNGLPFEEPDLKNYYTKKEIDALLNRS